MPTENKSLDQDLRNLKIDRQSRRRPDKPSRWSVAWIIGGVLIIAALGGWATVVSLTGKAAEVETFRVMASSSGSSSSSGVILNAAGYIVAHHKIQLTSKVVGKVAWIGVEKGDLVKADQVLVRLEDAEYRAQFLQAEGNLKSLEAQLLELENGSRPEEIARAKADVAQAQADLENARVNLQRVRGLSKEGVLPPQELDNAQARYDAQEARVNSLTKYYELVHIGPRPEQIEAMKGRVEQAKGEVDLRRTFLDATVIKAPVTGTILERAVEVGEFVTTSFVGERGAKGYVVSLADLNDLQVELDISQDDFAKLTMGQKGNVTTDAFPDRKYEGVVEEMSPEANRQKATVQVKVKISKPDSYLRPEMNARVAFLARETAQEKGPGAVPVPTLVFIPSAAIRDSSGKKSVFIVLDGRASEKTIKVGGTSSRGVEVSEGLRGGEEIVMNPPAELKNGDRVKSKTRQE
jgi:HlyD family secretion protein